MMLGLLVTALLAVAAPQAATETAQTAVAAESALVIEARTVMDGYAVAIRTGNHAAVSALYSRDGAWIAGGGRARFVPHDAIVRRYSERWDAPAAFEWQDLTFIPTGPDAITVIGRFLWTTAGQSPDLMSYHGHFVREDGQLRIRIEDEALVTE